MVVVVVNQHDDDGEWDSNSANDADVDGDNDEGGRQQLQEMQPRHSSRGTKSSCFATKVVRATFHHTCSNDTTR